MADIFSDEKYQRASQKAIDFIKRQLNVNNYTLFPTMEENYGSEHLGNVICHVNMPENATVIYPKYICCKTFYDEKYIGVCEGYHQNTGAARKNLGVEVVVQTDQGYKACICPLHEDGTWRTETYYRTTEYYGIAGELTSEVTYWYSVPNEINEDQSNGLKSFKLRYYAWADDELKLVDVDHLPGPKEIVYRERTKEEIENHIYPELMRTKTFTLRPSLLKEEAVDDALPVYADFDVSLYVFEDVEYLVKTQDIIYDGDVALENLDPSPPELPPMP